MPKHGSKNLIESTHKEDKTSIIRMTDLASCVSLFLLGHFQSFQVQSFRLLLITREQLGLAV